MRLLLSLVVAALVSLVSRGGLVVASARAEVGCGARDARLDRVAQTLAERKARGQSPLDLPDLALAVQAERVAHVWPRAWVAEGPSRDALERGYGTYRAAERGRQARACGVGTTTTSVGREVLAVISLEVFGELVPLKERVRVGEFLPVEATLRGARGARIMVKGPLGAPRVLPGGFDPATGKVRATFAADARGAFVVQVVAETDGGPRPVLEARVFADVPPSYTRPKDEVVPPVGPPDEALFQLVQKLREDSGLPRFVRDPKLDAVAKAHVEAMIAARTIAHDTGDGDPRQRAEAAGVRAKTVGENVGESREVVGLHRALTESPSHYENLRSPRFERMGVAVVADARGALWGCELFVGEKP